MTVDLDFLGQPTTDSDSGSAPGPDTTLTSTPDQPTNTQDTNTQDTNTQNAEVKQITPDPEPKVEADKPRFSLIVGTFTEGAPDVPTELEKPADFAARVTVRNITERNMGAEGVIPVANVYAAMRATRHPLPVVMLGETAYLAGNALEVWDARPARGSGSGEGTELTDERLLELAGSAKSNLEKRQHFVAIQTEKLEKAQKSYDRRVAQMAERNLSWNDAERAYAELESKRSAKKEIPDDTNSENTNSENTNSENTNSENTE